MPSSLPPLSPLQQVYSHWVCRLPVQQRKELRVMCTQEKKHWLLKLKQHEELRTVCTKEKKQAFLQSTHHKAFPPNLRSIDLIDLIFGATHTPWHTTNYALLGTATNCMQTVVSLVRSARVSGASSTVELLRHTHTTGKVPFITGTGQEEQEKEVWIQ